MIKHFSTPGLEGTSQQATQKSDRPSFDFNLWADDKDGLGHLDQHFNLLTPNDKPEAGQHIIALSTEREIKRVERAVGKENIIGVVPPHMAFYPPVSIVEAACNQRFEAWQETINRMPLKLEEALAIARDILVAKTSETLNQANIELEVLMRRCDVSNFDWWNRYIKDLEAEIHATVDGKVTDPDERLRLDLQLLLKETDPIKLMRKKASIAIHNGLKISEIEKALRCLDDRSKVNQPRRMGLDELFNVSHSAIEYVMPGMLPLGETVLLVASPKVGKSLLAYDFAFAVATGESNFLGEQVKQGKVLIIQCDESVNTARGRLFKRGFRQEDTENVQFVESFKITQLDLLEEWLESFRPTLVIVDSLRRISAGRDLSENSAEFADAVYQLKETIARYNAAGILIHHSNKNSEAVGVDRVRGSSAISGAVWGVWQLDHILKPDPENKNRMIIDPTDPTRILSVTARDVEGQRLKIELNPENNSWLTLGEVGVEASEINERKTHEDKILELLKPIAPTGLEASEINAHLNIGRGVYNCLHRLLSKSVIGSRPSAKDRRRTVYFYPKNELGDTPPSLPPTPTDHIVIEYPETLTTQGLEIDHKIDHNIDHKINTEVVITEPVDSSNVVQTSISEVDHKNPRQGGEGGSTEVVINPHLKEEWLGKRVVVEAEIGTREHLFNGREGIVTDVRKSRCWLEFSGSDEWGGFVEIQSFPFQMLRKLSPAQGTWNCGDKVRYIGQHQSYKKYLGKVLTVTQDNPRQFAVSVEGTFDKFSYHSIERV